jgi:hypothetical protein
MEDINDFKWNIISYAILMIYHFGTLQIIALVSTEKHPDLPLLLDTIKYFHYF